MNKYDVVIHMDETRFWVALVATVASGLALVRHFGSLKETPKIVLCARWVGPFWPCKWGTSST